MVRLKNYPAKDGDAFLVVSEDPPSAILVDGGYAATYRDAIRGDLSDLAAKRRKLELVVATHVDGDHVGGLISLFRENGNSSNPNVIPVDQVFHNSLRALVASGKQPALIGSDDATMIKEISRLGYPQRISTGSDISARQGSSLAKLLRQGNYSWNLGDGTRPITSEGLPSYDVGLQCKVTILSPPASTLQRLFSWWTVELRRLGYCGPTDSEDLDEAFEFICARNTDPGSSRMKLISRSLKRSLEETHIPDTSITNGSSISMLIELGKTRLLMLGDAWPGDVERSLRALGGSEHRQCFDAIKISHHGSNRNTSPALLEMIDAPHYLISTDGGKHNHPDIEVLEAIVNRPASFRRTLHCNFATPASSQLRAVSNKSGSKFAVLEGELGWINLTQPQKLL